MQHHHHHQSNLVGSKLMSLIPPQDSDSDSDSEIKRFMLTFKTDLIHWIGCALPLPCPCIRFAIQSHLKTHYCRVCGEYLKYNSGQRKPVIHLHDRDGKMRWNRKEMYVPPLLQHIHINSDLMIIEWKRRFPQVKRLPIHEVITTNPSYVSIPKRIQSIRLWHIDEWNLLYPDFSMSLKDRTQSSHQYLTAMKIKLMKVSGLLFVPDLVL